MNHVIFTRRFILATAAAVGLAACQSGPQGPVAPSAPEETLRQFMAAVNAQDLEKMALLWGTERGPSTISSRNSPDARHQQLTVMQRVLAADSFRVRSIEPVPGHETQRRIDVDLMRGPKRATVPFVLVPARTGGWLVSQIRLDLAMPLSQAGTSN